MGNHRTTRKRSQHPPDRRPTRPLNNHHLQPHQKRPTKARRPQPPRRDHRSQTTTQTRNQPDNHPPDAHPDTTNPRPQHPHQIHHALNTPQRPQPPPRSRTHRSIKRTTQSTKQADGLPLKIRLLDLANKDCGVGLRPRGASPRSPRSGETRSPTRARGGRAGAGVTRGWRAPDRSAGPRPGPRGQRHQ